MKRTISLLIFAMFLAMTVYGFDPIFLSSLSPVSLKNAQYSYSVKHYNGKTTQGTLTAAVKDSNNVLVSMKIGNEEKKALIHYSSSRGNSIDAFYIFNNKGAKMPFYDAAKRGESQDPNSVLKKYKLVSSEAKNVRTVAGVFSVTENKYEKQAVNKVKNKDLEMVTNSNDEVTVDEYQGFPIRIVENTKLSRKIVNLRDPKLVIPSRYKSMTKQVKIELTSYEKAN